MALPARYRHTFLLRLDTAVPFKTLELQKMVREAAQRIAVEASVESPKRDVQNVVVTVDTPNIRLPR
jgi:hypothetical protein